MDKISATEFQLDTANLLDRMELLILGLEKNPRDKTALRAAVKGWHELKSLAALFELQPVAALAFQLEGIMTIFLAGPRLLGEQEITWLLNSIDLIKKKVAVLATGQPWTGTSFPGFSEELSAHFHSPPLPAMTGHIPVEPPAPARLTQGNILIIEDELINRTLLEALIRKESPLLNITSVDSAEEGLFYYFSQRFDLVFLDIMMPNVDGNHFISIVEKNHQAGHLRFVSNIVVQTAIPSLAHLTALAKRECVQEIIRKPITPFRIGECIRRYCGQS